MLKRLLKYIVNFFYHLLISPLIVLTLISLRPFVLIRATILRTDAIGHLASNYEIYCHECDVYGKSKKIVDVFFIRGNVCNEQLVRMWKRRLFISKLGFFIDKTAKCYPGLKQHVFNTCSRDKKGVLIDTSPSLEFSDKERKNGELFFDKYHVNKNRYVCVSARDSAYKNSIDTNTDWSYHNYNNVDIETYIPALELLVDNAYEVLRMGAKVSKKLSVENNRIFDYATNGMRTDFLDIYLLANCQFMISNGSGIDSVPQIFRKPLLYVNCIPLEYIQPSFACDRHVCLFKKLWMKDKKRFMSINEIMGSKVSRFLRTDEYKKANLEIIDNTAQEIKSACFEMIERLEGRWLETEDDVLLQKRFWSNFKPNNIYLAHIGRDFLRENMDLL